MYSPMGRHLKEIAKFGPWANSCSWASVSGLPDIFLTQLDAVVVLAVSFEPSDLRKQHWKTGKSLSSTEIVFLFLEKVELVSILKSCF